MKFPAFKHIFKKKEHYHAFIPSRQTSSRASFYVRFRRRFLSGGLLTLAVIAGIVFWRSRHSQKPEAVFQTEVDVLVAHRRSVVHSIKSPGTVTYLEKASVSSRIPGRLQSFEAEQGMDVKRGQTLARLERLEMDLQLNQARASLRSAESEHRLSLARYHQARREVHKKLKQIESSRAGIVESRAQYVNAKESLMSKLELYRMGGISKKDLRSLHAEYLSGLSRYYQSRKGHQTELIGFRDEDLAKNGHNVPADPEQKAMAFVDFNTEVERNSADSALENVNKTRVEVRNTERLLAETVIRSPINGTVATRTIEIGEEVKAGDPIFTIVRMDELLVSTNVAENDLHKIRKGQQVLFTIDAFDGEEFKGTVRLISPVIDLSTRTAEVRVDVHNTDRRLAPGMFTRCMIETGERGNAILVPEDALVDPNLQDHTAALFVLREDRVFRVPVKIGEGFEDGREILTGLQEGDRIAISNVSLLKEGTRVRPRPAGEEPKPTEPAVTGEKTL